MNPHLTPTAPGRRRRPVRQPTIHDVAEAAGVSKSAVSLAIRNQRGVSETTREHILAVAQELGYRSNVWARSLVQGRTGLVGILLQDLGNSYHRDVTAGVEDAATERDLRLVIGHGRRNATRLQAELDSLLALGVEGVIIISSWVSPQYLERISKRVPLVVIGRLPDPVPGVDTVANRDEIGARLAVEHLTDLGHTNIAHLTSSSRPAAMHRRAAFTKIMRARLPGVDPQVEGPEQLEAAIRYLVFQIQQEKDAPTAVFTQNDRVAADLVGACLDAGVRLPDQLSIVGYDNSSICRMLRPQLTSVDQPRHEMGRLALEMLSERLAGRTEDRHVTIAPELVVRASTKALREPAGGEQQHRPMMVD
ncbi:LacI family DNA-binding transcriptional regulator [Nesterenkonia haasae]|uniref:LacI family DNA-binding transcriptional regulator n=1 Tax=Nesterenkonia haasae TaxID=2587813 RepID=UPI001391F328|nr:LacI family DNA-binding transcriptional regulator [Nesterenkonia haasae]NDK32887.1 LacI family transcriptional regulator [Nesterenkonia haasae]